MNIDRRKRIEAVKEKLQEIVAELETIIEEEQGYFDNMPESFQSGERGQKAENAVSELESCKDAIEGGFDNLDEAAL